MPAILHFKRDAVVFEDSTALAHVDIDRAGNGYKYLPLSWGHLDIIPL